MQPRLDTVVRVETPEGITLPLRCAGALVRSHAFALDALIRLAIAIAGGALLSAFEGVGTALNLLLLFALEWLYPVVFEMGARGATPGKRAMGLRVVMDDGMPPTWAASLLRNLLRVVDFLPFAYAAGVLAMLLSRDFKRLGDIAAGTRVVHERPAPLPAALPLSAPVTPLTAITPLTALTAITPITPIGPALPLSAAQQTAVVDWALRTPRLTPARAEELAALAAPVLPAGPGTPGQRLLSLAHWALGHR